MVRHLLLILPLASFSPAVALSQRSGGAAQSTVAPEASQFDFLIGLWEVTVTPKPVGLAQRIHGAPRLAGTWKAWRTATGGGIEDELRIVDRSGNPVSLTRATRSFDVARKRWTQTLLDVNRGRSTAAEGTGTTGAITLTGRGTDAEGKPIMLRRRFFDITPTSFTYQTDQSTDGGRTWDEGVLKMEARRVAAVAPR